MANDSIQDELNDCRRYHLRKRILWGVALLFLGTVFLFNNLGWIDLSSYLGEPVVWWHYWPLVLVLSGVVRLVSAVRLRHVYRGFWHIGLGIWLFACLEHLWGLSFHNSWPVLIIGWGLGILLGGGPRVYRRRYRGGAL